MEKTILNKTVKYSFNKSEKKILLESLNNEYTDIFAYTFKNNIYVILNGCIDRLVHPSNFNEDFINKLNNFINN